MNKEIMLPSDYPSGITRRELLQVGFVGVGLTVLGISGDTGPDSAKALRPERLADIRSMSAKEIVNTVYETFRYDSRSGLYIESTEDPERVASVWPFSDMQALLELAVSQGLLDRSVLDYSDRARKRYKSDLPPGYPPGYNATLNKPNSRRYVDDNLWLGLLSMWRYVQTGSQNAQDLDDVKMALDIFMASWDHDRGGAMWEQQIKGRSKSKDRVIVSNATAIPLLVAMNRLGLDSDGNYRKRAVETYEWLQTLRDPEAGLYFDGIRGDGTVNKTLYTYCQAMVIDAIRALHTVDEDNYSLAEARHIFELCMQDGRFKGDTAIGVNPALDVKLVRSGMLLALDLNDPVFTAMVKNFSEVVDQATRARGGTIIGLLDAAGAGQAAILAQMPPSEWYTLEYAPRV